MGEIQGNNYLVKTALIAGGTGLIGAQLLRLLLDSGRYGKVIAITRKELSFHPKLTQHLNEGEILTLDATWSIDDVYCCLGTTIAKSRSKEKFYQVDFTYPYELATRSLALGAKQFLIVTALGAQKTSPVYYNRVKGEIEEALSKLGFNSLHIFRPSLLLGDRNEKRTGEEAAKIFYQIFGFIIPKKYKAIDAAKVARAMLHIASMDKHGKFIHESGELQDF
jgi:uncharacterized protein YbjT (DUF2867 family)